MKRIGALFLIVMSLQVFGEQYRTLKEANANITLSEIGSSNGKIERAIKAVNFSDYQSLFGIL